MYNYRLESGEEVEEIGNNSQWQKKLRRIRQELDQNVIWNESTETPNSLSHSKSFALHLTGQFDNHISLSLSNSHSLNAEDMGEGGFRFHLLIRLMTTVLESDNISDFLTNELCEHLFGSLFFMDL
jgi:hypothetical protein